MKALVFYGAGEKAWEDKPTPILDKSTDAIVHIKHTTICGTDLHIMRGSVPTAHKGVTLGHEGVGIVEELGNNVTNFKIGDKVLISCITSCGKCLNCRKGFYGHCSDGGWILGNTINGCQAERVRIPHADGSLYHVPDHADEQGFVMLSDILSTGLEVGVLDGKVRPGCSVAIVGAGPVGLAALITAQFYAPAQLITIDVDPNRLEISRSLGATHAVNNQDNTAVEQVMNLTEGQGVDVVIEAIGTPAGWDLSEAMVAAGGNLAVLGVHGKSVTLHLEHMWKRNFTMTAGLVHTTTIPMLMKTIISGRLQPRKLISHYMKMSEIIEGYNIFANAAKHCALKVLMTNDL